MADQRLKAKTGNGAMRRPSIKSDLRASEMLWVLIPIFVAVVVAAVIIDRKQKYSDDKDVKTRPSPGVQAAIGGTSPWIREDGYLHIGFPFPSEEESPEE
ncbi:MAG: hypothetical protein ACFFCK_11660 [Promethearchaeota archaeon]